ncbi:translation initiation factor IF-2, partial [bacterium]|nr:translation initiation factor IF-2 [bacterium]
SRAPVISIMGHVDHGKTTLLDSIRASKHKIVNTEVGGITQSIGAYTIYLNNNKKVVFLDTPGHEAFTEMRARGAKATDIAILVVAADDGIMPQTIEAINHAKAAEIPIIVAVNKIDKAGADPDRILTQLTEHGLVPEAWGGDTITCQVSALQRQGIDELLEYILLVADMQDLKANPNASASGVVIEANLDKGKGPVATLLVQNGTLKVGNCVVVGTACGRVRALLSDSGEKITEAEPSTPVEILGLTEVPQAGDAFEVVANEKEMKAIIDKRKETERTKRLDEMLPAHIRKEAVSGEDNIPQLNLIIKANTHGAAEAVSQAIAQMESDEIATKIIHVGVGDISEADVMLASASKALILGFTVKEDSNALSAAEREHVTIKKYDIIYQILEDMEKTMLSLLEPEIKEVALGKAEIRQVFTIGKTTKIAGCYVLEGKILRNKTAVLVRNGQEIFRGAIDQLKRFKDDVKEVAQGFECGISFAKFNDIQEGDIIEVSTTEEVERSSL